LIGGLDFAPMGLLVLLRRGWIKVALTGRPRNGPIRFRVLWVRNS
jgi:hypothetical protein